MAGLSSKERSALPTLSASSSWVSQWRLLDQPALGTLQRVSILLCSGEDAGR